jgi:hypothetical protein
MVIQISQSTIKLNSKTLYYYNLQLVYIYFGKITISKDLLETSNFAFYNFMYGSILQIGPQNQVFGKMAFIKDILTKTIS